MQTNSAAEHLQVIRTLMERAALYRRALAPIMFFTGAVGLLASVAARVCRVETLSSFCGLWLGVALVTVAGVLLLARRQALKDAEAFWSPPLRRVTQALMPPLTIGLLIGVLALTAPGKEKVSVLMLPIAWMLCYGCGLHAAGFFVPRGLQLFGWFFILSACALWADAVFIGLPRDATTANTVMGAFFGVVHLAYGLYLRFTENRKDAA
ncbi:MAG: hypothetical protein HZA91_11725 [Verrucomicrobia bacterium]|nr:hypothetical protein [Verrucomicrobiota bacterium]